MKKLIPGLTALFITCLSGLFLTYFFYSRNSIEIEPVLLEPMVLEWQTLNNGTLNLCELGANTSAYRGREVVIEASQISVLTSHRFVILGDCGPETYFSANIILANGNEMDKRLLFQLSHLMTRRYESTDAAAEKVIIRGVVQANKTSSEYVDIVASDVQFTFAP